MHIKFIFKSSKNLNKIIIMNILKKSLPLIHKLSRGPQKTMYRMTSSSVRKRDSCTQVRGADSKSRLIWIDLELTGLDVETDVILEVACVITESNLDIVANCPDLIINQPNEVIDSMSAWSQNVHMKSGLIGEVVNSKIHIEESENIVLDFVKKYTTAGTCPLAGNTVYVDRKFLAKYMPTLEKYIHFRIVDVSTIKELCRRWNPNFYADKPVKKYSHRASLDIVESINELKYYKSVIFNSINEQEKND